VGGVADTSSVGSIPTRSRQITNTKLLRSIKTSFPGVYTSFLFIVIQVDL